MKGGNYWAVPCIMLIVLATSCTWWGTYGKIRVAPVGQGTVTVQGLKENWRDYTIYYTGASRNHPSGILFDPKKDGRLLRVERWIKVEDEKELGEIIDWIERSEPIGAYFPRLWTILGPEEEIYGYLLSPWDHLVTKKVDQGILEVLDLPPPIYYVIEDRLTGP